LIVVEALLLTVRFDLNSLGESDRPWTVLLRQTPLAGQFAISLAVALIVFSGERLYRSVTRLAIQIADAPLPWIALAAHLVAFAALFPLTAVLLEGEMERGHLLLLGAWILATLTWLGCWLAALLPVRIWRNLFGRNWSTLGLGAAVAAAAVLAGHAAEALWQPLAAATFWLVERVLELFYIGIVSHSEELMIGTEHFRVIIAPHCSGFEGIGLILVFLSVFFWCFRSELRFPHALLLLPVAIAAIWTANALRIAALVAIGTSVSPSIAMGGFHSQAGWIAFNAVALACVIVAWRIPWFRSAHSNSEASVANPTAPYLVPFLALVAAAMITGAFSDGFDRLYGLRVIAAGAALALFAREYQRQGVFSWDFCWAPIAIGLVVFGTWMALEPHFGAGLTVQSAIAEGLASLPPAAAYAWIAFRAAGSIVIAPMAEELAFRGYLTRRLVSADFESVPLACFSWFGMLASSAVFGLMHGRWLAGTVAGVLFALAMYRRGQLMDAIVAHATANLLITAYVLTTSKWEVWS
jgi:exosortase E/protease (VPEID-CTERM system)